MNHIAVKKLLLGAIVLIFSTNSILATDAILKAMNDEISRSIKDLYLESLKKPYYIEYTISIAESFAIKSTLGAITESGSQKTARLTVGLRIGSYKFDNTNFFDLGLSFFGSGDDEETFVNRLVPIDPDYASLRRELWLATDAAYKQASEIYSKKEAVIKNRMRKDTTWDFVPMTPRNSIDTRPAAVFDIKKYEEICRKVSSVFNNYPAINNSSVSCEYIPQTVYYANSEGSSYVKIELYSGFEIVAATQASDGMPLVNYYSAYGKTPDDYPTTDSLTRAATAAGGQLSQLTRAATIEEAYSGPVIFEPAAAAEAFAQIFDPNLVAQRQPLTETGMADNDRFTAFQSKIGGRVLPEFISVTADPKLKQYDKTPLLGYFNTDDEAVESQKILLVSKGYLKNLLSSRVPTRRVRSSNGHKRGGAAMLSTIIIQPDSSQSKPMSELKSRLIQLCKDRELPYGIVIRKVLNINILYTTLFRMTQGTYEMPRGDGKLAILEAYKLYSDGSEEPIRGCHTGGFAVQTFKDIILCGNTNIAYNYLAPSVISPYMTGGDQFVGSSVVTPAMLFEDCEIRPSEEDFRKPPIVASPLLDDK